MHSNRALWRLCWCGIALLHLWTSSASAADKSPEFKPGDRIEAKQGSNWFAGVVVSVDKNTSWIAVKLDDVPDFMSGSSENVRERALKTSVPAIHLRRPAKQAAAKPAAKASPQTASPLPAGVRIWNDRTGKFKVKATYQGLKDGKVVLETEQGKRIEVSLEKLSDLDAKFVKTQSTSVDDDPFEDLGEENLENSAKEVAKRTPPTAAPAAAPVAARKFLTADRSKLKVFVRKDFNQWTFKPAVLPVELNAQAFGKQVTLGDIPNSNPSLGKIPRGLLPPDALAELRNMIRFLEQPLGLFVADDGTQAVIARRQGIEQQARHYLQPVDFVSKTTGPLMPLPEKALLLDVSTQENLVAYFIDEWGPPDQGRELTVARAEGRQIVPLTTWRAKIDANSQSFGSSSIAWFLPGRRLMLLDARALGITIWNVDTAEALYNIPIASAGMGLSANRQIMALAMPTSIALIDLTACEHIASLPLAKAESWRSLAFSDDNTRLAGLCDRGMFLWDLTTGKLLREFWHQTMANVVTMRFAGDFLLLDEQYLYDPERRILLWEYANRPDSTATIRNGRMWAVLRESDRTQSTSVVTAKVPHAKAIETANGLGTPEALLIAKPGDPVAIKIDIDPSVAATEEVRAAIAANLVAAGFKVVDQADLVLTAVCHRKDSRTIKLRPGLNPVIVNPADIVEKTFTPHASYVTLAYRGEKVFDQGYLATPNSTIHLNPGENLDQALARLTSPNIEMIKTARYASYIARAGTATPNGAYGTSRFATKE